MAVAAALVVTAKPCDAPYPLQRPDPALQARLEARLSRIGLGRDLASRRLAVSVVDLSGPNAPYYAGVNDDVMLYAASLPKIAILLAVVQLANEGRVEWTPAFAFRLRKMITISNNAFASWGADVAGLDGIAEVMRRAEYCFYEPPRGGLWMGRAYRKGAKAKRDPVHNISHGATSRQTARWYLMLDQGLLVSHYWSERMRDLMGPPDYFHKFVAGIGNQPGVRFIARKSGTWRLFHSDSALIQHHARRYVVVGLAEMPDGEQALRNVARIVDDLIMEGDHRRR
ncbi:MAG: serine hydrolase [Myxococcota bacterium]